MTTVTFKNRKYQVQQFVSTSLMAHSPSLVTDIEGKGVVYSAAIRMVNEKNEGSYFERYRVIFDWTSDAGVNEKNIIEFISEEDLVKIETRFLKCSN